MLETEIGANLTGEGQKTMQLDFAGNVRDLFQNLEIPSFYLDQIISLTQQYGVTVLTLIASLIGIILINKGSSKYGKLSQASSAEETRSIVQSASANIFAGSTSMGLTTLLADNRLFSIPQITMFLSTFIPFLASRLPSKTQDVTGDTRMKVASYGFPLLFLTIFAGTTLIVGSSHSAYQAYGENKVGLIMSLAFLILNGHFTMNELREVLKVTKLDSGLADEVEKAVPLLKNGPDDEDGPHP